VTALRNRLVTEQDGRQHVGGLVLTTDEIGQALDMEIMLHRARGWDVRRYGATLRLEKDGCVRWIWVRSREPMEDTL
jgi:hypothetical protein